MGNESKEKKEKLVEEQEQVIKMSYRKMVELINSGKLAQLEKKPFHTDISVWLGRVMDKMEAELQGTFRKRQLAIVDKFAEVDKEGKKIVLRDFGNGQVEYKTKSGKEADKNMEVDELLDCEVDIHIYRKRIPVSRLPETMQPAEMRALDAIADIVDDSSETKEG